MIQMQTTMQLSSFMDIYEIVIPRSHLLRKFNELVDFFSSTKSSLRSIASTTGERRSIPCVCSSIFS